MVETTSIAIVSEARTVNTNQHPRYLDGTRVCSLVYYNAIVVLHNTIMTKISHTLHMTTGLTGAAMTICLDWSLRC